MTNAILFYQRELGKLTIPELLAQKGFYKECTEFKEEYTKQAGRFRNFQPFYGKQFLAKHSGFLIREGDSRLFKNLELFRISPETSARCVNDEEILERRIETHSDRRNRTDDMYSRIPLHCYLHMFHLELHRNCWIHVDNLEEYRYRPELKTKLILPPEHRKLIDILTSHMDVSTSDIVPGKSGGTTHPVHGSGRSWQDAHGGSLFRSRQQTVIPRSLGAIGNIGNKCRGGTRRYPETRIALGFHSAAQ